jgi:DNA-binding response OmpR family regulator
MVGGDGATMPGVDAIHAVLIVEDEYFIAREVALALESTGAKVLGPVGTVADARELIVGTTPDFAILDINLHGETIFDFADELAARDIRFVFATGYDADVIPERYRNILRWEKPFDAAALVKALSRL